MTTHPHVHASSRGPIGSIVFSNLTKRNALTADMTAQAISGLQQLGADDAVRVITLRGADGTFVSGADVERLADSDSARFAGKTGWLAHVAEVDKPVVALLEGWCLGGGALLALAADLRIGTKGVRFGIPAARVGIGFPINAVEALVRLAGYGAAAQLLLSGEPIDGARAYEVGLINWVFDKADFDRGVSRILKTVVSNAPLALKASKHALAAAWRHGNRAKAMVSTEACWTSDDFVEGQRALLEGRAPQFRGF